MKPNGKAEPRFDRDYSYGRQGELQIDTFLNWIATGNGQVEVKRKRYLDLNFYVETSHDPGRTGNYVPSGISVSTALMYAYVIGDTGISVQIPTDELRAMLDDSSTKECEERDGSCPTRGKLVSLAVLLYRHKQHDTPAVKPVEVAKVTPALLTAADINWSK